ncbi:Beta-scruin like protein [Argiope bruennichi]|uniref:Beta-scruin like protein n=1 Tax=Argiope bruennichi TaxID=94029 RepID=A0A8T0FP25_ARGBR|nr:Beta-scruin like protein [Argiope bruennichi]
MIVPPFQNSEVIVFLAALKWISVRYLDREQFAIDVIACVRFPMMTLNEILACHSPPLLPGLMEVPEIRQMLLKATCFIAAKTINEEKRFQKYDCQPRTYLLDREPIILWDPNIFDPERHALYAEEQAATTIQAAYRGYQTRKSISKEEDAAETIQKAYRDYSQKNGRRETLSKHDSASYNVLDFDDGTQEEEGKKGKFPFAEAIRRSVTNIFRRASSRVQDAEKESQIFDEDESSPEKRKKSDDRRTHPPYKTDQLPEPQEQQQPPPPPWLPEVSSSLDALAGTVANMTKNLEVTNGNGKPKGKLIFSSDHHFEEHDRGESLDFILAKEKEYKFSTKMEPGSDEEIFRAIIVVGGFNATDGGDESESDYKTPAPRRSPCCKGQENGKLMFLYDPAANQWSGIGQMPKPRHHHRLVYLNNILYSIGGCDPNITRQGKMVPMKTCYSFDLSTRKWRKLPRMHHSRMYHGAAALDGKIYVVGGKDDSDSMLDSIEVYDPESNKWQELPDSLNAPTMGLEVCAHNGQLWVIGGMVQNGGKTDLVKDVRCYDPVAKAWNADVPNLPFPRAFIAAVECVNRVYVIGGTSYADTDIYSDELNSLSEMLYYDEIRKMWRKTTDMPEPCHFVAAATCGKSLFVLGGLTSFKREALDQVVVFTEISEQWHRCSSLPVPLCGFAAVAVPKVIDGK